MAFVAGAGTAMTVVVGVDGCPAGWVAVVWDLAAAHPAVEVAARWSELPLAAAAMVAVDMPIGLAEAGPRGCDGEARKLLPRGRTSSVFPAPRRYMLRCADWAEANALGKARDGKGLSHQAWNIIAKIRELDAALTPADQDRVRETHPELVFHRLNDWRPVPPKKTAAGREMRMRLLEGAGLDDLNRMLNAIPRSAAKPDDILDAAVCAVAGRHMLEGRGTRVPAEDPPRDARGLRMEIWF